MKILITGGLGFVGTNLSNYFLDKGHSVIAVGRAATQNRISSDRYRYISGDTTRPGDWPGLFLPVPGGYILSSKLTHRPGCQPGDKADNHLKTRARK